MTNEARSRNVRGATCHLLIDPPAGGAWNMALDEALLEHAAGSEGAVWLRFYQWREPTLSLGYFQPFGEWRAHVKRHCAVVRRQTGGGAILHDRELTYSLILPPGHPAAVGAPALYGLMHQALLAALERFGVWAELYGPRGPHRQSAPESFYCFQRRSPSDVVIPRPPKGLMRQTTRIGAEVAQAGCPGVKICGSAQRRRKGAVLMHGSLLLSASPLAPQILGIKEVTGHEIPLAEFRTRWLEEIFAALNIRGAAIDELPDYVRTSAGKLADRKYSNPSWTGKR